MGELNHLLTACWIGIVFQSTKSIIGGVSEGVSEGLNDGVNSLLFKIKNIPGRQAPFLAEELNVPVKTIERWLKNLRDEQKIEFRGASRTGGYWVKETVGAG